MSAKKQEDITALIKALDTGKQAALEQLIPPLYDDLHRMAHRELERLRPGDTLNTTALVHEVYLKLAENQPGLSWHDRSHFFAVAAHAMRYIVIDYLRGRQTAKRGGGRTPLSLEQISPAVAERAEDLLALDEALKHLEQVDAQLVRVVECRVFVGLTVAETAVALDTSPSTVDRSWKKAKLWLHQALSPAA